MSDTLERVRKIVIEHLDADPEKVTEKASFIDDLGADSLDNVELVMAFEEEFDIEIPDDAAEHIQTVGAAVKFIGERLGPCSGYLTFYYAPRRVSFADARGVRDSGPQLCPEL